MYKIILFLLIVILNMCVLIYFDNRTKKIEGNILEVERFYNKRIVLQNVLYRHSNKFRIFIRLFPNIYIDDYPLRVETGDMHREVQSVLYKVKGRNFEILSTELYTLGKNKYIQFECHIFFDRIEEMLEKKDYSYIDNSIKIYKIEILEKIENDRSILEEIERKELDTNDLEQISLSLYRS